MKVSIATADRAVQFMRRAGYGFQKEGRGEVAFIRRVGSSDFPRYHAYVTEQPGAIQVNLHVDQKAPTYGDGRAHSGEYDGPLIAEEAARLQGLVASATPPGARPSSPPSGKRGFWGRLLR